MKKDSAPPSFPPPHFTAPHPDFSKEQDFENSDGIVPPPGPPPGYSAQDPEAQNQQYLPPGYRAPPKSIFQPLYSHAPDDERDWGDHYTNAYPIYPPRIMQPFEQQALTAGNIMLVCPPPLEFPLDTSNRFKGQVQQNQGEGTAYVRSYSDSVDTTFVSSLPIYSPHMNHLRGPSGNRKFYFEILITELGDPENASIAIGFVCLPYPVFRLPGWHRGSVAVHSDDGRRYVNDSLSGKPFVAPFRQGDTIGIGISLDRMAVFLSRNGHFEQEWSMVTDISQSGRGVDPDRDYKDGGIEGLEGDKDIYAAVGVYGDVGAVVNFTGSTRPFLFRP